MDARHTASVSRLIAFFAPLLLATCSGEQSAPVLDISFVLPEDASFTGAVGQYDVQVLYTGGEKNGMLLEDVFQPSVSDDGVFAGLPPTVDEETARIFVSGTTTEGTTDGRLIARADSGPLTLSPGTTHDVSLFLGEVMAENQLPQRLPFSLAGHTATRFPGSRTLLAGGTDPTGSASEKTILFDDGWQTFVFGRLEAGPDLMVPRVHHASGLVIEDDNTDTSVTKVVLLGGDPVVRTHVESVNGLEVPVLDLGPPPPLDSVEWLAEIGTRFEKAPPLTLARSFATATQTSDTSVLLCGGVLGGDSAEDENSIANTCEHWNADGTSNTFGLHTPRLFHQATLLNNGQVLLTGGVSTSGITPESLSPDAEILDPEATLPELAGLMVYPRAGHVAVTIPGTDGEVLIAGGYTRKPTPSGASYELTLAENAEIYMPSAGSQRPFAKGPAMQCPRAFPVAAPIGDGVVLIVGGIAADGVTTPPPEIFDRFASDDMGAFRLLDPNVDCTSGASAAGLETTGPPDPTTGRAVSALNDGDILVSGGTLAPEAGEILEGDVLRVFVP